MRKFIFGFILGTLFFSGISYGYRIAKPIFIQEINPNSLVALNNTIEQLWDLTNGRYSLNVETSVPSGSGTEGDIKAYSSGGVYRIYVYLNGGWRAWTSD